MRTKTNVQPSSYSFARYLSSKKTVDDRALNKDVVERLRREVSAVPAARLNVLELGAGVGSMVARLIDWKILRSASYRLLEVDASVLAAARPYLGAWAAERGHDFTDAAGALRIQGADGVDVSVEFHHRDLASYLAKPAELGPVDLLVANAFLDLVDLPVVTRRLVSGPAAPRLFWFSINFDGETIFEPAHEHDQALLAVYHRSMDERVLDGQPAGDSRAGRHLFTHLRAARATVLAAGASDWVVWPGEGAYASDEAYFLHHIIDTIERELRRHAVVNQTHLAAWVALRHAQIERGELVYLAHQIDVVGRPSQGVER